MHTSSWLGRGAMSDPHPTPIGKNSERQNGRGSNSENLCIKHDKAQNKNLLNNSQVRQNEQNYTIQQVRGHFK